MSTSRAPGFRSGKGSKPTEQSTAAELVPSANDAVARASVLGEAGEWLRLQENSPDGFVAFRSIRNPAGKTVDLEILYINPPAQRFFGGTLEQLRGK